jgi:uncharacterized protein (TIGR02246 family)
MGTVHRRVIHVAPLLTLLVCGCAPQHEETDIEGEIRAVNDRFMAAFADGNGKAVAMLYTQDAQILPPGTDPIHGRPDIGDFWQEAIDSGVASVDLSITEVTGTEEWAYEVSRYLLRDAEGDSMAAGKYMVIWKRTAAGWRLHRDVWN